jgi:cell division septal protein FtsQ
VSRVGQKVLPLPARARRRVDVMQLVPSGRSLVLGIALVSIAIGLYGIARETSLFAVSRIEVDGASPAVADQVRGALRAYDGQSLVGVNAARVAQRAETLPTVHAAVVDRAFPHTLQVRVEPEVPVAVLRRGGEAWLVSVRGRVIVPSAPGANPALPRIWLPLRTEIEVGAMLGDEPGGLAARSMAAFVGSGFPNLVAFVRAADGRLSLGLRGGLEIRLGAPADLRLKIAIVRRILPTLAAPSAGGPDYLDVAVPERPVAGRNPQPEG